MNEGVIKKGKKHLLSVILVTSAFGSDLSIAQQGADCGLFSPNAFESGEIVYEKEDPIPVPLTTANFTETGAPSGGYLSITDLVTFNGDMYLGTSNNPLIAFGTKVFYTTDGVNFTKVLEDASSH